MSELLSFDQVIMRRFVLLFLLLSSLFLTACIYSIGNVQAENSYFINLEGDAWNRSTLNILLVTPNNVSWWGQNDLNAALRAIGQWNDAIDYFASNYSDYAYLSSVRFQPTVSNETEPGYNIYLNWTEFPSISSNELGLETTVSESNVIIKATVNLAVHTSHGDALSDGDLQNVALHELGHSLGLGHSNVSSDVMYPYYTLDSSAKYLSTLDLYGIATVFSPYLDRYAPVVASFVVLPSNIQYTYLPVSPKNGQPQTLANNVVVQYLVFLFEVLIHPEILAGVVVFVIVIVVIALMPVKKRRIPTALS